MWIERNGPVYRVRDLVNGRKVTLATGYPTKASARAGSSWQPRIAAPGPSGAKRPWGRSMAVFTPSGEPRTITAGTRAATTLPLGSRGGLLSFLGALVIFMQHYGIRKLKYVCVVLFLLAGALYIFIPEGYLERAATITSHDKKEDSRDARLENYRVALKMFLIRPVAGFGLNNFQFVSVNYGASHAMVVHNTYLEILVGGGLLSFIPFLLILKNSWKKLKIKNIYGKNIRDLMVCLKASFVSILITSFFITAGHKKILWFLIALISSAYYIAQKQNDNVISGSTEIR